MHTIVINRDISQQILEAAFADIRIAFEVQEDVPSRRLRQNCQAESQLRLENVIDRGTVCTRFDLEARLLSNPFVSLGRPALRLPLQRKRYTAECRCRAYALRFN